MYNSFSLFISSSACHCCPLAFLPPSLRPGRRTQQTQLKPTGTRRDSVMLGVQRKRNQIPLDFSDRQARVLHRRIFWKWCQSPGPSCPGLGATRLSGSKGGSHCPPSQTDEHSRAPCRQPPLHPLHHHPHHPSLTFRGNSTGWERTLTGETQLQTKLNTLQRKPSELSFKVTAQPRAEWSNNRTSQCNSGIVMLQGHPACAKALGSWAKIQGPHL